MGRKAQKLHSALLRVMSAFLVALLLTGCTKEIESRQTAAVEATSSPVPCTPVPSPTPTPEPERDYQAEFTELNETTTDFFQRGAYLSGMPGGYILATEYTGHFPDITKEAYSAWFSACREFLDKLEMIDRDSLSKEARNRFDALQWTLENQMEKETLTAGRTLLHSGDGLHIQLLYALYCYPISSLEDAESFLKLLGESGKALSDIQSAGKDGIPSEKEKENLLAELDYICAFGESLIMESFSSKLATLQLDEAASTTLEKRAQDAVRETMLPGYRSLRSGMECLTVAEGETEDTDAYAARLTFLASDEFSITEGEQALSSLLRRNMEDYASLPVISAQEGDETAISEELALETLHRMEAYYEGTLEEPETAIEEETGNGDTGTEATAQMASSAIPAEEGPAEGSAEVDVSAAPAAEEMAENTVQTAATGPAGSLKMEWLPEVFRGIDDSILCSTANGTVFIRRDDTVQTLAIRIAMQREMDRLKAEQVFLPVPGYYAGMLLQEAQKVSADMARFDGCMMYRTFLNGLSMDYILPSLAGVQVLGNGMSEEKWEEYLGTFGFRNPETAAYYYDMAFTGAYCGEAEAFGFFGLEELLQELSREMGASFREEEVLAEVFQNGPAAFPVLREQLDDITYDVA